MDLRLIYDDTVPVAAGVRALMGIESFGDLIYRRRTLSDRMRSAAEAAGLPPPLELRREEDWAALQQQLDSGQWSADAVLICSANVVATIDETALITFLRQAQYSPVNLHIPARGQGSLGGWLLLLASHFPAYLRKRAADDIKGFFEEHRNSLSPLEQRLSLVDINDEVMLPDFLSGALDARFFNAIVREPYTITKRSTEKKKLSREFAYYKLLPPLMQSYFVMPFDWVDEGEFASYRMQRLFVPDVALQWLHGAFAPNEFERLLDQLFHFLSIRAERKASNAEATKHFNALYIDKVTERVAQLKSDPEYSRLEPFLKPVCGSVDDLMDRYLRMMQTAKKDFPLNRLVIGHGDLCFSNILYNKSAQLLRLIDPRGAENEDELYTDPYYDLAKLSHSIQGGYDHVNHDMFDMQVNESMGLDLKLDRPRPDWASGMFNRRLEAAGFDPRLVRLCEASLFISMLPLHMDRPRKVLGFAINAKQILDQIHGQGPNGAQA